MPATTDNPVADLENASGEINESGKSNVDPNSSAALDEALRAEGFNPDGSEFKPADIPAKESKETPAAKTAETPPKADEKPAETPAVTAKTDETPAPAAPAAKDELDSIELPPHTKPKTAESFANVKNLARQRIAAIEKERDELKTRAEKAEEAAKAAPKPEELKELEELRKFRKSVDVEADPAFKDYDKRVSSNTESIYSKLTAAGFDKDAIARVKELGPDQVDWDKLAAQGKIPSQLKRYIDAKLIENEDLSEKKRQAVAEAKKNADEYLKGREADFSKSADAVVKETAKEWEKDILPQVSWLLVTKIDDKMKPEEKTLAESHNKMVEEVNRDVKDALQDNSPRMKALMIAGYATGRKMRFEFDRLKAGTDAKIASLEKELKEKQAMLDRIKNSSPGRVTSSAPPANASKKVTQSSHINVDRGDHLDALLAEAQAREAEKGD